MEKAGWHCALIQASFFYDGPRADPEMFWGHCFDFAPDVAQNKIREGISLWYSTKGVKKYNVGVNPIRVDIAISASDSPITSWHAGAEPEEFDFVFAKAEEALQEIMSVVGKIAANLPFEPKRVALIARMLHRTVDTQDSQKIISHHVKSIHDAENASDLLFRINWKHPTEIDSVGYVNRITQWATITARVSAMTSDGTQIPVTEDKLYVQLELDINTPAELKNPLHKENIEPIFQLLSTLALENVEKGEIR